MTLAIESTSLASQIERLRRQLLCLGQALPDPEDLIQETAMACHRKPSVDWSVEHPDYIIRAAKDQLVRFYRRSSSRTRTVSFESLGFEIPDNRTERYSHATELELLHRAIESLPDNYRLVITKRVMGDMSFPKIANELGIKECTARQWWRRGLTHLRRSPLLQNSRARDLQHQIESCH